MNYYKVLSFEASNDNLLESISKYILKSDFKLHKGYLNVAGLFFSKKKCPTHANPYPAIGTKINNTGFRYNILVKVKAKTTVVPTTCNKRQILLVC